jgi:hypothetical protein
MAQTAAYLRQSAQRTAGCSRRASSSSTRRPCEQEHHTAASRAPDPYAVPTTQDELTRVWAPSDVQETEPAPSSPEPTRPPWFHVERRRPLACGDPFRRRAPARSQTDGTVSRGRGNSELHASKLDRPHLGHPQACLELSAELREHAGSVMSRGCEGGNAASLASTRAAA